jgi:hypothetical protein
MKARTRYRTNLVKSVTNHIRPLLRQLASKVVCCFLDAKERSTRCCALTSFPAALTSHLATYIAIFTLQSHSLASFSGLVDSLPARQPWTSLATAPISPLSSPSSLLPFAQKQFRPYSLAVAVEAKFYPAPALQPCICTVHVQSSCSRFQSGDPPVLICLHFILLLCPTYHPPAALIRLWQRGETDTRHDCMR